MNSMIYLEYYNTIVCTVFNEAAKRKSDYLGKHRCKKSSLIATGQPLQDNHWMDKDVYQMVWKALEIKLFITASI